MTELARRRVVVGIDGSPDSRGALRWAHDEAKRRDAVLHVIAVCHWDVSPMMPLTNAEVTELISSLRAEVREVLDTELGRSVTDSPDPNLKVEVLEGHPAEQLTKASEDADLLVVGTRGHGAFRAVMMGSVSRACVTHARCPVVVVPGTSVQQETGADEAITHSV